jgi:hypothetical protein
VLGASFLSVDITTTNTKEEKMVSIRIRIDKKIIRGRMVLHRENR